MLTTSTNATAITRHIDGGTEVVKAPLPIMLTVNGDAAPCRPRNAKRVMKYKRAMTPIERPANGELPYAEEYEKKPYLNITQWTAICSNAVSQVRQQR